jgi:hypothetical protein
MTPSEIGVAMRGLRADYFALKSTRSSAPPAADEHVRVDALWLCRTGQRQTVVMTDLSRFGGELRARFSGCHTTSGGEVWVRHEDAVAALDLAREHGLRLLGMEGFVVGDVSVYPSMSRIADYSSLEEPGTAYDHARALLIGPWVTIPDDLHSEAEGHYMIDLVVAD